MKSIIKIPATPFAQDYSTQIQAGLKLQKDKKEKQKEAINKAKGNR